MKWLQRSRDHVDNGYTRAAEPTSINQNFISWLRKGKQIVVFLDYDGTLSPIVSDPKNTFTCDQVQQITNKVAAYAGSWIKVAQAAAHRDQTRLMELHTAEGLMPSINDPESFSFWLATLTNQRPRERLSLLRLRDTKENYTEVDLVGPGVEQRWWLKVMID